MGYTTDFFWYDITPRQTDNILHGYLERVNSEHERRVFEMRLLTVFINNSFAPKNEQQTFEQIYPLKIDKELSKNETANSKAIAVPITDLFKMFTAVYNASGNEREITD